jgi:hypothetical protein
MPFSRSQDKKAERDRQSQQTRQAHDRAPRQHRQQNGNNGRQCRLPEIAGKIIDSERSSRGIPVGVRHQQRSAGVLDARSQSCQHKAATQARKAERQRHHQKPERGDEGR